jgi:hypothetical protein
MVVRFPASEPVFLQDLLEATAKRGFTKISGPAKIGSGLLEIERLNIARKGDCDLIYDVESGVIGVAGKESTLVVDVFEDLKYVFDDLQLSVTASNITYVELVLNGIVSAKSKVRPLRSIADFYGKGKFDQISTLLHEEVAPFSVRFYPKSAMDAVNDLKTIPKWFDISISPNISNPKFYGITIVFRDTEIQRVEHTTRDIESLVMSIIKVINGE